MPQISSSYVIAIITPSFNHYKSAKNFLGFIIYFNFDSFKLLFTLVFNILLGSLCIHIHFLQNYNNSTATYRSYETLYKIFSQHKLQLLLMPILEQLFTSETIYTLNNDETLPTKTIFLIKVIHMFTNK
jgi:hypothetical protein